MGETCLHTLWLFKEMVIWTPPSVFFSTVAHNVPWKLKLSRKTTVYRQSITYLIVFIINFSSKQNEKQCAHINFLSPVKTSHIEHLTCMYHYFILTKNVCTLKSIWAFLSILWIVLSLEETESGLKHW